MTKKIFVLIIICICSYSTYAQVIQPGAWQMQEFLPVLKNKNVAVFANQTSVINSTHLVDTLISKGVKISIIFGPEHGFRGNADAGEHVSDGKDAKTGIDIISLYGDHKKPTAADLKNIDIVIFDIQDVGVRFYTYISSLQYVIEACLEQGKKLIILDRPNPNGFYVDGPVLNKKYSSFVGLQAIPIVYGMTIGEYTKMLIGEQWLSPLANTAAKKFFLKGNEKMFGQMQVVLCKNYDHKSKYILPINPSPNLKDMRSIYWYPSTCFFEGTVISEGRGTDLPFVKFGHPKLPKTLYSFVPNPNEGAKASKLYGETCYGYDLSTVEPSAKIDLGYFFKVYQQFPDKNNFFLPNLFIDKLAGTDQFRKQVLAGNSEETIKKSWQKDLDVFKKIRKKYLLYKDF